MSVASPGGTPETSPETLPFRPIALQPADDASYSAALARLRTKIDAPAPYEATLTTHEWANGTEKYTQFRILYRPPDESRTTIVRSNQWPEGTILTTGGGGRPRVRMPGLLAWITFELPERDVRTRTANGMYAEQVTPGAFARMALSPEATGSVKGVGKGASGVLIIAKLGGVEIPPPMRFVEIGIAWPSGVLALGRLWQSPASAYEFMLTEVVERDVTDSELGL